jgi:hypothetical protein
MASCKRLLPSPGRLRGTGQCVAINGQLSYGTRRRSMKFISIIPALAVMIVTSPVSARCPARSSFPWAISDQQGASQSIFIPTTKAVAAYRICVSLRASSSRNSTRWLRSNVDGLTLRLACGIDGRDMGPPCVSLPLKKAGTCVDVRTEGTIVLVRTAGAARGRAEGVACPIE